MGGTKICINMLLAASALAITATTFGRPRPPLPLVNPLWVLWHERFNEGYSFGTTNTQLSLGPFTLVESWSGFALDRKNTEGTLVPFIVPGKRIGGVEIPFGQANRPRSPAKSKSPPNWSRNHRGHLSPPGYKHRGWHFARRWSG
jgi:hypothetical protein